MIVCDFDDEHEADDWEPDDPGDDDTDECAHCGSTIYDDSEQCPRCGRYLSWEDAPRRRPWWIVATVLACLAMVAWWVVSFY